MNRLRPGRLLQPLRVVLDLSGAAIIVLVFAGIGDSDVLFHVVWVLLTAEAFLYGIRTSLPRIALAAATVVAYALLGLDPSNNPSEFADNLLISEWPLMLAIILMVAVMADREMTASRRYAGLYRRASDQLITAQEDERRRLALDLHDGVGQTLTAANLTLDAAIDMMLAGGPEAAGEARGLVEKARTLATDALDETRGVATALRPPRLHERGLASALEDLAAGAGVSVQVRIADAARRPGLLDTDRELETYRIVQEALANACRHAAASRITLSMDVDRNALMVGVDDDGHGFATRRRDSGSLGIAGMHERAAMLGATLRIRSRPGAGTTVRLAVPVTSVRPTQPSPESPDGAQLGRAPAAPRIGGAA